METPKTSFTTQVTGTSDSKPAASTPAAPGTASIAAPAAAKEPVAFEYQTLTVEQILNKFQQQLEGDALAFAEEAKRVCAYDATLIDSQRDLARLTAEASRLMLEQDQIENNIDGIDAFQNEIEKTLTQVELQVDQILQNQSHLAPHDADLHRQQAYDMAMEIDRRLEEVKGSLNMTSDSLETSSQQAYSGETAQILTTLTKHQKTMVDLENEAGKLEIDCLELTRQLQRSGH